MEKAVIVEACRTSIARAGEKGWLRNMRSDDMAVVLIKELLKRVPQLKPGEIEDVIIGCAMTSREQGANVARNITILAGIPFEVAAQTVNRFCASSLESIMQAARAIMLGDGEIMIAGGIESMTHVPMGSDIIPNQKLFNLIDNASFFMGQTAEIVAERWKISRQEQDEFALWSHQKAVAAQGEEKFKKQIVPVEGEMENGTKFMVDKDQCPRRDTSLEKLSTLKLAFRPEGMGTITAGNSSPLNDGAAMVLMMSEKKAKELGLKILAEIKSMAVAGVAPEIMGTGPIPATRKALKRAGLELKDLDVIEINEAFAVVPIVCCQELGISKEEQQKKLNLCGGAVAIGHPLGASGARIVNDLLYEMERRDAKYGLATMCIGMGEGSAIILGRR